MNIKVGKIIVSALSSMSTRIYPLVAPVETKSPFIVYRRTSSSISPSKDSYSPLAVSFDIDVWADDYDTSLDVAQQIVNKLEGKRGVMSGIDVYKISVDNVSEMYGDDGYCQTLSITIKYND